MLFFQLDLPHRAFICQHNLLIMFWISQVLFNLVDCPSKARCFINMTIPHEWNGSSFPVLLLGILFVHQDRCKLFSRISFFGRNNPTGLLFFTQPPPSLDGGLKNWSCVNLIALQWLWKKKQSMGCSGFLRPRNWPRAAAFLNLDAAYLMTCVLLFLQCDALSFFRISCKFSLPPLVRRELN